MPKRWQEYRLYVDGRLVEATSDYAFALELYRVASRQVPRRHREVRIVAIRGTQRRTILRKPRSVSRREP